MNLGAFDPLALATLVAGLALLPLLFVCTTCFLKVSVVLMIVRNALGVQQVPPSMVMYGLALAVTLVVMAPVGRAMTDLLMTGTQSGAKVDAKSLMTCAEPLRGFMLANTLPEHRKRFVEIAARRTGAGPVDVKEGDFTVLLPAFVVSELNQAFRIGFVIYVPFIVIDLLISNLLLALGMQMVSPMTISLPLKLLLMVVTDGWTRLLEGLALSYL